MVLLLVASSMISLHRVQAHSTAYREATDGFRIASNLFAQDVRKALAVTVATDTLLYIVGNVTNEAQLEFRQSLDTMGYPIVGEMTLWRMVTRTGDEAPLMSGLADTSRFEQDGRGVRLILVTAARDGSSSQTMTTLVFPQGSPP